MVILCEVPQKPYTNGSGVERYVGQRFDFGQTGFRVARVLSGDLSEIIEPDKRLTRSRPRGSWPAKTTFHLEFLDVPGGQPFRDQQRVKKGCKLEYPTKGTLAIFVAEEIRKALSQPYLYWFQYTLDQLIVTSVDVRSRGTIQPMIVAELNPVQESFHTRIGLLLALMLPEEFEALLRALRQAPSDRV